jgi:hypothetical protein
MNLRTIVGRYELEHNQDGMPFMFTVPNQFTWEALHTALDSIKAGAKEWEAMIKRSQEETQAEVTTQPPTEEIASEVTPEVTSS